MTSFAHVEHCLIVLMLPTKVFREFGFVLLWILPEKNVRSLNWRPFFLSELRFGTHKELLQLVVDLSCVEQRTRHCVPLLVDMKKDFALLKLCYGAAYVYWNVPQLLLGFPLVYGVWHSYSYCVELIYRAFCRSLSFWTRGTAFRLGLSSLARSRSSIWRRRCLDSC